jgi:AraC-like DNA-binding protein
VLSGSLDISVDRDTYAARQGDIVAMDACQVHGFSQTTPGSHLRFYHFDRQIFSRHDVDTRDAGGRELLFAAMPILRRENGPLYKKAAALLDRLFDEYQKRESCYRFAIKSLLYQFGLLYLRDARREGLGERKDRQSLALSPASSGDTSTASAIAAQRVERVISFIYKNCNQSGLSLDQAAQEAALSRFHFTRFFKKQTNMNFHDYVSMARVSHAKEFLTKTESAVTAIAYQSGFASLATFNRVFKAKTGATPRAYREQTKNSNN